jgi:hypothetical protein
LDFHPFGNRKVLEDGKIDVPEIGSEQ